MVTDTNGTTDAIIRVSKEFNDVNIFSVFVGGEKVRQGLNTLAKNKMLCYNYPTDIVRLLGLLKKQMVYKGQKNVEAPHDTLPSDLKKEVDEAVAAGLASIPQTIVNKIMDFFKVDYPKSGNFVDKDKALKFCKTLFPNAVVLKLSAPDALHKTEMKGIYLNINNEEKFEEAWEGLWASIKKFELKGASVLIQEMITKVTDVIIGVNYDKTFGNVMIFGTGGIYTEVMKDTSLRILPTKDFSEMIKETKVGRILNGVRGEAPKAVGELADTMEKIQRIIFAIPEIKSIDINPILVIDKRAVVVDFKMILATKKK